MGRVSRPVYKASADTRNKLNGTSDPFPFKVQPLSICIVGGGAAGMSTALALSTFGHKVTIVEREKNIGGHACSVDIEGGHSVDPAFGAFLEVI